MVWASSQSLGWGIVGSLVQDDAANSSTLDDVKTVADIVGTLVTALAVIVGAVWAYYRFVRGRTYRPRLEVAMDGQWLAMDASRLLLARVRVENIGASKVQLLQKGTGLRVRSLAEFEAPGPATWEPGRVYAVFEEHSWVEPGETVSDDVLLRLEVADGPVVFETRLVCETRPVWKRWGSNITVFARQVVPHDSTIDSRTDE